MPWLTEQLLEAPELLIGTSAEFAWLAATLAEKHAQKTASMGDQYWSAHKEGRHKFLSGGALCSMKFIVAGYLDCQPATGAAPGWGGPGFAGGLP